MLVDECNKQYGYHPGDDATACVVRIRRREPMNMLFGPPRNRDDCDRMMSLFFSKEGKHIVCGGTTSSIAAKYLGKTVKTSLTFRGKRRSADCRDRGRRSRYRGRNNDKQGHRIRQRTPSADNELYEKWSLRTRRSFYDLPPAFRGGNRYQLLSSDSAVNPAHQNPDLPINFNIKMNLVEELSDMSEENGQDESRSAISDKRRSFTFCSRTAAGWR